MAVPASLPATCATTTTPYPVTPPARADVAYLLPSPLGTSGSGSSSTTASGSEDESTPTNTREKIDHSSVVDNGRETIKCSEEAPLVHAVGITVKLCGLVSAPELNGLEATIKSWNPERSRYRIELKDGQEKFLKPENVQASDCETRPVELCLDQGVWLNEACEKYGQSSPSDVLARLIDRANGEPPKTKRTIFLVIRCRLCLQHSRGGDKRENQLTLSNSHWQWLSGVRDRCKHSSVAKTLRIIVDFYMPLCKDDPAFEQALITCRPLVDAIGE